ncbi:ARHGDIG isoform 5, partial [Pongo abelii]
MSASCDGCVGSRPSVHLASRYSLVDLLVLETGMGTQCWTEDQRRWSSVRPWSHLSSDPSLPNVQVTRLTLLSEQAP